MKVTNKCHINSMKWNKHKYITNAPKVKDVLKLPWMHTCSISQGQGTPTYTYEKREKQQKKEREKSKLYA